MSFEFLMGVLAGIGLSLIGSWVMDRARFRLPPATDAPHRTDAAPSDDSAAPPW